jgi:predicted O-methyltransferase YrrM
MKWEEDLAQDIRVDPNHDSTDHWQAAMQTHPYLDKFPWIEMSENNRNAIKEQFLKVKDHAKCILEIGVVQHNVHESSYIVFTENKKSDTIYIGLDVLNKSHLHNPDKNIYQLQCNSSEIEKNMEKIRAMGVTEFDFIFIDGDHSVSQVLKDWEYTQFLAPNGIVGFHDVSTHPGPTKFIKALNKDKWEVLENLCPVDWGVGFCWKK